MSRSTQVIERDKNLWDKVWVCGTAHAGSGIARKFTEREVPRLGSDGSDSDGGGGTADGVDAGAADGGTTSPQLPQVVAIYSGRARPPDADAGPAGDDEALWADGRLWLYDGGGFAFVWLAAVPAAWGDPEGVSAEGAELVEYVRMDADSDSRGAEARPACAM
eukprot:366029-Chlamydomonas_euryale.AAC.30